jgi:hypothetical protein
MFDSIDHDGAGLGPGPRDDRQSRRGLLEQTTLASIDAIASMPIRPAVVVWVVALIGPCASGQVQGGGVSGVALSAGHELFGSPLLGAGIEFRIPGGDGRFSFRFGGERLRGQSNRIGIPCAGLVPPGTCFPEPLRGQSRVTRIRAGGTLRLLGGQRSALALAADWMGASTRVSTQGQTSGYTLIADKVLWGPWRPWVSSQR